MRDSILEFTFSLNLFEASSVIGSGAGGGIGGFQEGAGPISFKEKLRGPKEKSHQHDDTLERGGGDSHPFGSAYPHNLLKAAADLSDLLISDGPDAATPAHIISGHIDQLDQLTK